MAISQEAFEEMIRRMDKDGDGDVDRDEYKIAVLGDVPRHRRREGQAVWDKIDADGDGNLMQEGAGDAPWFRRGCGSLGRPTR